MHRTQSLDTLFHYSLNCWCLVVTYAIAIVICVLFEAPLRALLNQLLAHVVTKIAKKSKITKPIMGEKKNA